MNGYVTIGTKLDKKQLEKDIKDAEAKLQEYEKEGERLATIKSDASDRIKKLKEQSSIYDELIAKRKEYEKQLAEKEAITAPALSLKGEDLYQFTHTEEYKDAVDDSIRLRKQIVSISDKLEAQKAKHEHINRAIIMQEKRIKQTNSLIKDNVKEQDNLKNLIQQNTQAITQFNDETEKASKTKDIQNGFDGVNRSLKGIVKSALRWGLAIFGIRSAYNFLRSSISTISQYNEQVATDIEYIRFALASTLEPVVIRIINLVKTLLNYVAYIAKAWFGVDLFAGASLDKFNKNKKALGGMAKSAKEVNKQLAGFDEMNVLQDNTSSGGGGGGIGDNLPSFKLGELEGEVPDWLQFIVDHKDEILAVMAGVATGLALWKLGLDPLKSLGIGLIITGVVLAIEGLLGYLKEPTWENFGKVIQGIGIFVIGLGVAFLGLPAVIVGVVILIYGTIIKYWDKIKEWLDKVVETFKGKSDSVHKVFGDTIGDIYDALVKTLGNVIKGMDNTFKAIKRIFDDVIALVKAIINGDWKTAWEKAKDIVKTIFDTIVKNIKLAFESIWGVLKAIGVHVGDIIGGALKGVVNGILAGIELVLNTPIRHINTLIGVINKVPGINLSKLSTFKLPRLAKGGIINQPGRGVAIGGESGKEGVIPLTDSQQMALLGEAIGKYVNINATMNNYMNGRLISRELQKIQNENDFAFNR